MRTVSLVLVFLSMVRLGIAQNFRGGINGIVTDQTGAIVAGAEVKATNEETAQVYTTTASTAGEFSFQDLPLGNYTIAVTQSGFSTIKVKWCSRNSRPSLQLACQAWRCLDSNIGGSVGRGAGVGDHQHDAR